MSEQSSVAGDDEQRAAAIRQRLEQEEAARANERFKEFLRVSEEHFSNLRRLRAEVDATIAGQDIRRRIRRQAGLALVGTFILAAVALVLLGSYVAVHARGVSGEFWKTLSEGFGVALIATAIISVLLAWTARLINDERDRAQTAMWTMLEDISDSVTRILQGLGAYELEYHATQWAERSAKLLDERVKAEAALQTSSEMAAREEDPELRRLLEQRVEYDQANVARLRSRMEERPAKFYFQ